MNEASPFSNLLEHITAMEALKERAVDTWLAHPNMSHVFEKYNMEPPYFREHYAEKTFEYFAGVVKGQNRLGDCPVMTKMIDYFKNRDMTTEDLFGVCSAFRQTLIRTLCDGGLDTPELIDEVQTIADKNFASVITYFNQTIFSDHEEPVQEQLQLLKEYQKVFERGAIVSKTDTDGIITYVNNAFCTISGYSKEELIGQPHNIVRHPKMRSSAFKKMWETIQAKKTFSQIIRNRKKNGGTYYVHTTIIPILNRDNDIVEYIAMRYDVTNLMDALEASKQAKKAKDEFLSNVSHEIRTPLNAILGFVHILKKSIENTKHIRQLDVIEQSGQSLLEIINDILDFSKIESGKFRIDPHAFAPHKEFANLMELFAPKAQEKKITFLTYIDPLMPGRLVADILRIKQIVTNLIGNAVKFTPNGGRVEVEILYKSESDSLVLSVKDNGIGIETHKLESIFNAFEQADGSTSRKYGGTGLGLSITKKLTNLMNGSIAIQSEVDKGSSFVVMIPVEKGEHAPAFDAGALKGSKVAFLYSKRQERYDRRFLLIKRYLNAFGISETYYTNRLEEGMYDYVILNSESLDREMLAQIAKSGTEAVAFVPFNHQLDIPDKTIGTIHFPIYASKILEALRKEEPRVPMPEAKGGKKIQGRVLVAEDNRANQQLVRIYLEEYGLDVVMADDGKKAVERFKNDRFDLVLADNLMPGLRGCEVAMELLAYEQRKGQKHTPVVALSGSVSEADRAAFLAAGMQDVLAKPIDVDALDTLLRKYLSVSDEGRSVAVKPKKIQPVMTIQQIAAEVGIKEKNAIILLRTFLEESADTVIQLTEAVERKDYEAIRNWAHSLKGSAANLRLEEIARPAKAMEKASERVNSAFDYAGYLDEIKEALERAKSIA